MSAIPHPFDSTTTARREQLHAPEAMHDAHGHAGEHHQLSFFKRYIFSTDHKIIGIEFLFVGMAHLPPRGRNRAAAT